MDALTRFFAKTNHVLLGIWKRLSNYLNELFPLWHVRLIGICDGVDTNDMKNLRLRQINGLINEWYSEDLSDNIRQILRDKMMRGQFIGSFACYGYTKDPAHLHSLIPDPPAAAVVREIYQLYLDGFSLSKIASLLTKKAGYAAMLL